MKEAVQVRIVRFLFYIFLQNFASDLQASERAGADILRRNRGAACDGFPSGSQDRLSESLSNGKHTSAEGCEVIWAGYLAAGGEVRCRTQAGDRRRRGGGGGGAGGRGRLCQFMLEKEPKIFHPSSCERK